MGLVGFFVADPSWSRFPEQYVVVGWKMYFGPPKKKTILAHHGRIFIMKWAKIDYFSDWAKIHELP